MAKGYTDVASVAALMHQTFTSEQNALADSLMDAAEAYADRVSGQSWKVGATVSNEDHFPQDGPYLWLRNAPITAVTSVLRSYGPAESSPTALVAGTDYELQDAATGRLWLRNWSGYGRHSGAYGGLGTFGLGDERYRVTYTTPNAVDPRIALATRMLVAHWMGPLVAQGASGIKSLSIDGTMRVDYDVSDQTIPADVTALLKSCRRGLVFA